MMIVTLEEYTCRTWPAFETVPYDGWLLRFADGCTNRSNAVYPLYRSTYEIDRKLAFVEQEYTARGLPPTFKMTDAANPPALDRILESAGYVLHEPSFMMSAVVSGGLSDNASPAKVNPSFTDAWLDAYFTAEPSRIAFRETYKRLLLQPEGQRFYATVEADGRIVAFGLGSRSRDCMGIYSMATHPDYRGRGYAESIVRALLDYGHASGARQAILSVSEGNAVAQRVYGRCGFTNSHAYFYRVKPAE